MNKPQKLKYFILGMVVMLIISTTIVSAFAASTQKTITVTYSGLKIVMDGELITPKDANGNVVAPFVFDGTNYLPLRALGNAFGYSNDEIYWDSTTNTVYFTSAAEDEASTDVDDSELTYEYWEEQKEK